jgi:hypothetical protein
MRTVNEGLDLEIAGNEDVTLLELLDRLLTKGIVITGDLVISVARVDLIYIDLKLIISSVETLKQTCEKVLGDV